MIHDQPLAKRSHQQLINQSRLMEGRWLPRASDTTLADALTLLSAKREALLEHANGQSWDAATTAKAFAAFDAEARDVSAKFPALQIRTGLAKPSPALRSLMVGFPSQRGDGYFNKELSSEGNDPFRLFAVDVSRDQVEAVKTAEWEATMSRYASDEPAGRITAANYPRLGDFGHSPTAAVQAWLAKLDALDALFHPDNEPELLREDATGPLLFDSTIIASVKQDLDKAHRYAGTQLYDLVLAQSIRDFEGGAISVNVQQGIALAALLLEKKGLPEPEWIENPTIGGFTMITDVQIDEGLPVRVVVRESGAVQLDQGAQCDTWSGLQQAYQDLVQVPTPVPVYVYSIDHDERGGFRASVSEGSYPHTTVYVVRAGDELDPDNQSLFEQGFMRHKHDLEGLQSYLQGLDIIPADGRVMTESEAEHYLTRLVAPDASAESARTMP